MALPNRLEGIVASVDENGNLVTDISVEKVAELPSDDSVQVKFGGHETLGIFPEDHEQPPGTLVASKGSSGFVEIEIVGISLSEMLGIKPEVPVEVVWP